MTPFGEWTHASCAWRYRTSSHGQPTLHFQARSLHAVIETIAPHGDFDDCHPSRLELGKHAGAAGRSLSVYRSALPALWLGRVRGAHSLSENHLHDGPGRS